MKNEMILLDETELTVGCLIYIDNELGWNICNGYDDSIEEVEMKLEEFLDSVRVFEK